MKMRIIIEVDIPEGVNRQDVVEWISEHMDNIPYEMLEEFGIDSEEVEVGLVY